jgi:hypothetical protein
LRNVVVEYVVKMADDSTQADPMAFTLLEREETELGDNAGANMSVVDASIVVRGRGVSWRSTLALI